MEFGDPFDSIAGWVSLYPETDMVFAQTVQAPPPPQIEEILVIYLTP